MCGIVGYTGEASATPILVEGLTRMEYRGYDSAGVAVEQDVARMQGRQMVLVKMGAVRGIDEMARRLEQAVVRKNGEGQHHLVDLGLAVAAHAENVGLPLLQQGDDLLRRIALGQVVARAVIENVPQQNQALRALLRIALQQFFRIKCRPVQVGGNEKLHDRAPFAE